MITGKTVFNDTQVVRGGNGRFRGCQQRIVSLFGLVNEPGLLRIGLLTEPRAEVVQLEITIPTPEDFTTPPAATNTPPPEPTEPVVLTEEAPVVPTPEPEIELPRTQTDLIDWLIALLVTATVGLIAYRIGRSSGHTRWSIRWGLSAGIGGLLVYLYFASGLTGTESVVQDGRSALIWLTGFGSLVGWGLAGVWYSLHHRFAPNRKTDPPQFPVTRKQ